MAELRDANEHAICVDVFRDELTRLLTNVKKRGVNNFTISFLEDRLKVATSIQAECRLHHVKICAAYDSAELAKTSYVKNKIYEKTIEAFKAVSEFIWEHLDRLLSAGTTASTSESNQEVTVSSSVRLPKIDLPKFSGDFSEWSTFYDSFKSMIHDNVGLSGIQKFHYLKSCLTGEAGAVLKSLAVTNENYVTAWNTLITRYQNRRIITATLLNKITQIAPTKADNLDTLKALRDTATVTLDALRNMKIEWEKALTGLTDYPNYAKFTEFIAGKINVLESIGLHKNAQGKTIKTHSTGVQSNKCLSCAKEHRLQKCEKFLSMQQPARLKFVQSRRLCLNCLRPGHMATSCRIAFRCRHCAKPHHSLLHLESPTGAPNGQDNASSPQITSQDNSVKSSVSANVSATDSRQVLLATFLVKVIAENGRSVVARGLVDTGSETLFLTEKLAQLIRVKRTPVNASIYGITGEVLHKASSEAEVELRFLQADKSSLFITALALPKITTYKPSSYSSSNFPEINSLELADRFANSRAPIDLLIGADYYPQIMKEHLMRSVDDTLIAQSTIFGWIVSGILPSNPRSNVVTVHHCCELDKHLQRFWELEEVPSASTETLEDEQWKEFFRQTVSRTETGRFVVGLPFRSESLKSSLGASRHIAENSLSRTLRCLENQPTHKAKYVQFLEEYENLGHMTDVTDRTIHSDTRLFLPHHAVFKSENRNEKIRVVFNASCKTSSGISLNDALGVGAKLQKHITVILMNWRSFEFVGVTDIVKMFRQVLIREQDRKYQSILWKDSNSLLKTYELNTVTYGTSPAPFLSMRVIQELASRHGDEFPEAQRILRDSIYVDDLLFGASDVSKLWFIKEQLIQLLSKGGFELSKWAFNVSSDDSSTKVSTDTRVFCEPSLGSNKVLGVTLNPMTDTFYFSITPSVITSLTKRILLSENSRIFDPMGWISPVTVVLKEMMQATWLLKLSWDEEIPEPTKTKWLNFYRQLGDLEELSLQRWDCFQHTGDQLDLIGFCDASSLSYSAAVYARITNSAGNVSVSLLMAKSKVGPIKTVSIPRLELVAAALLTRLMCHIKSSLTRSVSSILCYSDSQIILAWIAQHPSKWKVFVGNRVSYIQTKLPEARWKYVPTKDNPADLNSRGIRPLELISAKLWWNGPEFLKEKVSSCAPEIPETDVEIRKSSVTLHGTLSGSSELWCRFSSWTKLVRVVAYIFRFADASRKIVNEFESFLTVQELCRSKMAIIRQIQAEAFPQELACLQRGKDLFSRSNLLSLSPILDSDGIIRVGGRLQNSFLSEEQKHPVILPQGHVADIIIRGVHQNTLHGGVQLTLATLRREFWVINARSVVKSTIHKCLVCVRERAKLCTQLMGSLPQARVTRSDTFAHTGVDYAGPFLVKFSEGRGSKTQKVYIALFVCLATRAIHLELVSKYDTESFLAALSRFVARRGKPTAIYSDNGLNFQRANAELRRAFKRSVRESTAMDVEAARDIQWQFIPTASPHWGGIWESGVRSVKHHLKRMMGTFTPSFEEMSTLLYRVEACLNSRPISVLHNDVESIEALTPGHFLTGRALLTPPENSVLDLKETTLSRWQRVVRITEMFWKKWSSEYLNTLQSRSKWKTKNYDLQVGDVVLIRNPNNPPCKWSMGRIIRLIPGINSVSRVVVVKTAKREVQRSITQLCKLPVN